MSITASPHLRGIVIAGALAAVAVALGFVTLAMNQSSSAAAPHTVLSLKARHLATAATAKPAAKPVKRKPAKRKPVDVHLLAALKAGLPRSVAKGLSAHRVAVIALTSASDTVAQLAARETQAGARLAGASFVAVSVDRDGGDASALTTLLGELPAAPATLVYTRPGTLYVLMPGFNDKTTIEQAARNALVAPAGTSAAATTTSATPTEPVTPAPATTTPTVTGAA